MQLAMPLPTKQTQAAAQMWHLHWFSGGAAYGRTGSYVTVTNAKISRIYELPNSLTNGAPGVRFLREVLRQKRMLLDPY